MKNLKKLLALLTATAMLAASAAIPVFAADEAAVVSEIETKEAPISLEELDAETEAEVTLMDDDSVASVGDTKYSTLADAISAAEDGDTVTLLADTGSTSTAVAVSKNLTIDLGNYTLTTAYIYCATDGIDVTVKNGTISGTYGIYLTAGNLELDTCTVTLTSYAYCTGGELTLTSTSLTSTASIAICNYDSSTVNIDANSTVTNESGVGVVIWGDVGTTTKTPTLNVSGKINAKICVQGNGTDYSGTIININSGAVLTATTLGMYLPQPCTVTIDSATVTGSAAIGIKSGNLTIRGNSVIEGTGSYSESLTSVTNGINVDGSAIIIDSYIGYAGEMNLVIEADSDGNTPTIKSENSYALREIGNTDGETNVVSITISAGTFTSGTDVDTITVREVTEDTIVITGGTFDTNVSAYAGDGYYAVSSVDEDGNTTYTISESTATFENPASQANYSVELVRLEDNSAVDNSANYTYTVTTETVDVEDYDVEIDDDTDTFAVDISVEVTDNLTGEAVSGVSITNQKVTITLPVAMQVTKITHVEDSGSTSDVTTFSQDSEYKTVTFTAPSFSAYILQGTIQTTDISDNVTLSLKETGTAGVYDVVLTANDDTYINRFTSAQLKLYATAETTESSACSIVLSQLYDYIDVTDEGDGVYLINVNDKNSGSVSGEAITIARLTLVGVGTYSISLDTSYENKVHTTSSTDNLVVTHIPDASYPANGTLIYTDPLVSGVEVSLDEVTLTINVVFPNSVDERNVDYTDMQINLSNVLDDDYTIDLGSDAVYTGTTVAYGTATIGTTDYNAYVVTTTVPKAYATKLEFVGAGYRTYRTSITPTDDATVTVWNNAMDSEDTVVISADENAMGEVTTNVTFLAGDIVANDLIDLWDLSAVVSYFGKETDTTAVDEYAKYDLNRDGKVDSRDIAMVLVSWNY